MPYPLSDIPFGTSRGTTTRARGYLGVDTPGSGCGGLRSPASSASLTGPRGCGSELIRAPLKLDLLALANARELALVAMRE